MNASLILAKFKKYMVNEINNKESKFSAKYDEDVDILVKLCELEADEEIEFAKKCIALPFQMNDEEVAEAEAEEEEEETEEE